MEARVTKWGNSLGIRVPSAIADQLKIRDGSIVDFQVRGNEIVIKPNKKTLDDLLEGVTQANRHTEIDWGAPKDREEW